MAWYWIVLIAAGSALLGMLLGAWLVLLGVGNGIRRSF